MLSVDLEGVGIDFPIYGVESRSLKKRLLGRRIGSRVSYGTRHVVTIHALHDVTLRIRRGERVGLTGPNGAGKSTLLRAMAGIYEPARGRVRVAGRVTTMFGLSLGLESDATGMENIRGQRRGCLTWSRSRCVRGQMTLAWRRLFWPVQL